MMDESVFISG